MTDPKQNTVVDADDFDDVVPGHSMDYDPEYDDTFDNDFNPAVDIGWSWDERFESDFA